MAAFNNFVVLFVLALLAVGHCQAPQGGPHIDQGVPHQNQGARGKRSATEQADQLQNPTNWTTCDPLALPKISCHDCNTRLICKPVGGLLKICHYPRPYCNNGVCSSNPSPSCA